MTTQRRSTKPTTDKKAHLKKEAIQYVNRIRERAGVRQYTFDAVPVDDPDYIQIQNSQEDVRRVVRMERRVELCCENNRWYDIRRWKIAEQIPEMCGDCYGMNALDRAGRTKEGFFQLTKFLTRVWKRQYYWFPIYVDEFEKNPNLKEAPFWLDDSEKEEN